MAEKFKICTDISSAIKNLGYIGDISYYKVKTNNKKRANLTAYLAESFDFLMNLVWFEMKFNFFLCWKGLVNEEFILIMIEFSF